MDMYSILSHLLHPPNHEGDLYGLGQYTDEPYLLYFDLTQCSEVNMTTSSCATPQVCVDECPITYWTSGIGKSHGLKKFCDSLTISQLEDPTVSIDKHSSPWNLCP